MALDIVALGRRGEGIARVPSGRIFVPYTLPGERVEADVNGKQGTLVALQQPSPHRVVPPCPHYGSCGGCALQHFAPIPYGEWKRSLIISELTKLGLPAPVLPLVPAHGSGRRRVTFHVRAGEDGRPLVGFMAARSHALVTIDRCLVLSPELETALPAARALAAVLAAITSCLDLHFTGTAAGPDCHIAGFPRHVEPPLASIAAVARQYGLGRVSINGVPAIEISKPWIDCAGARIPLPPGSFLQATAAGEEALGDFVLANLGKARRPADLFCGVGAFTLRLARRLPVLAIDNSAAAINALQQAVRNTMHLKNVVTEVRDLFREPLVASELLQFDLVVFDPPRRGAEAQARELAKSSCPTVIAISCEPATFARDAAILANGGFRLKEVVPVDQFKWSPHVEIAALFTRGSKPR